MEKMEESDAAIPKSSKFSWDIFFNTLPMKFVVFTFHAGAICVFPYLVLVYRQLGISFSEIAVIYLIIPVASLIGPVVAGLIADKLGKYGIIFVINLILMALFFGLILTIPAIPVLYGDLNCGYFNSIGAEKFGLNTSACSANNQFHKYSVVDDSPFEVVLKNCISINDTENPDFRPPCMAINSTDEVRVTAPSMYANCDIRVTSFTTQNTTFEAPNDCSTLMCNPALKCVVSEINSHPILKESFGNTFIQALIYTFLGMWFAHAAFTMMDAVIMAHARRYGLQLGREKVFGLMGFAVAPVISGALIDHYSTVPGQTNYLPAFLFGGVLLLLSAIVAAFLNIKVQGTESNVLKDLSKLAIRPEVDAFLCVVLILGSLMGFIETYLFPFLKELHAPNILLGITMTVGCVSGIPMMIFSDAVEKKIGRHNVFLIAFTAYAGRMIGYSLIQNAWTCLFFETLEAFTYQLMWLTCLKMAPILATRKLLASMTGLLGSVHYAFGRGIGGFLGGQLIEIYGTRVAFRVFAGIAFGGGLFYFALHHLFLKKRIIVREKELAEADLLEEKMNLKNGTKKLSLDIPISTSAFHASMISLTNPSIGYPAGSVTLLADKVGHPNGYIANDARLRFSSFSAQGDKELSSSRLLLDQKTLSKSAAILLT